MQQTRGQKYDAIEEQVVGIEDIPAEDFEDRATAAVPALSLTRRNYQKSTSSACTETTSLLPARTDRQSAAKPPDRLSISQESSMEDLMASTSSNLPNYYSPYANSSWLAFLTRPGEWCSYHPGPLIDLSGRLSGGTQSQLMVNSDDEVGNEDFNCLDHMSVEVTFVHIL